MSAILAAGLTIPLLVLAGVVVVLVVLAFAVYQVPKGNEALIEG